MKKLLLLAILVGATGCTTTMKHTIGTAKHDYLNFIRTIKYNAKQPAVYRNATFTKDYWPSNESDYL